MTARDHLPVVFLGHGNPMHALDHNRFTEAWASIGAAVPHPRAILAISAHWYVPGLHVTAMEQPRTIHDFGGFPPELFAVKYPAPGDPALAHEVAALLGPLDVGLDESWGLDHGTWAVLVHPYPNADVPIVALSLDATQPAAFHYELGRRLAPLRSENVLVMGSGNVVHNLAAYDWSAEAEPYPWATQFAATVARGLRERDHESLVEYERHGDAAARSIPTPEHYLPMLPILGASSDEDDATILVDGIEGGSLSMLSFRLG